MNPDCENPERFFSFQVLKDILLNLKGEKPFRIAYPRRIRREEGLPARNFKFIILNQFI
jgi:hypothetical protein